MEEITFTNAYDHIFINPETHNLNLILNELKNGKKCLILFENDVVKNIQPNIFLSIPFFWNFLLFKEKTFFNNNDSASRYYFYNHFFNKYKNIKSDITIKIPSNYIFSNFFSKICFNYFVWKYSLFPTKLHSDHQFIYNYFDCI